MFRPIFWWNPFLNHHLRWPTGGEQVAPIFLDLGVSENSGTPKSSILIGFSIINHPFWGTSIFGNTQLIIFNGWKFSIPSMTPAIVKTLKMSTASL